MVTRRRTINTFSRGTIFLFFVIGCTAERFFRIDRAQESLHYLIDITHDQLFVLDDPQRMPSTDEDVTVVLKSKEPSEDFGGGGGGGEGGTEDCTTARLVNPFDSPWRVSGKRSIVFNGLFIIGV